MPRLPAGKQHSRPGPLPARKRRARLSPVGYLANPASLTGIPQLNSHHSGTRLTFGDAKLTSLAEALVELNLANEADWIAAAQLPSALADRVIRRLLSEHGQELIAEHFELCLSLAESIVDTRYTESEPTPNGQLLLVLNTESSFPLGVGKAIDELEKHQPGLGAAFYNCLRQALYRWVRVYDDWDARNRIEQMAEWAEGEDDPDSYEIPKLAQDLPECLKAQTTTDSLPSLASFPILNEPWLRELVQTALELERVSHSAERPQLDEEWLERERSNHALDPQLFERPINVLVVGCGGNGSAIAAGLPYLHQALLAFGHPGGLNVTLIDPDTVSETNCVRQPFCRTEIGLSKAVVLAHRTNMFWGLNWQGMQARIEQLKSGTQVDILIGCVDTRKARRAISRWTLRSRVLYWLDLGNNAASGQFVLGQPNNSANRKKKDRLPTVPELYPEIVAAKGKEDDQPSCSAAEALTRQEPFINQNLAYQALGMLTQLLRRGSLSYQGGFSNLATGQLTPLTIQILRTLC